MLVTGTRVYKVFPSLFLSCLSSLLMGRFPYQHPPLLPPLSRLVRLRWWRPLL